MSLRETCHCGHDKATHYVDRDVRPPIVGACLAMACECRRYVNEFEPRPFARRSGLVEDNGPKTLPIPDYDP